MMPLAKDHNFRDVRQFSFSCMSRGISPFFTRFLSHDTISNTTYMLSRAGDMLC